MTRELIAEQPELVMAIQSEVLIIKAVADHLSGVVEYEGMSKHFKVLEEGDKIPLYEVGFSQKGGDPATWSFV